jgi:hypothetical protein
MILLDVSGSMDFDPVRPNYNEYLITGYSRSTQPKNKGSDSLSIFLRYSTDQCDRYREGSHPSFHRCNGQPRPQLPRLPAHHLREPSKLHRCRQPPQPRQMWRNVKLGGGTRVMTGWQKVKELHFQKHSESATHHPVYGWQAGPQTPMLRLLLLLDGEATDMDEFELDLLSLSWVHVTIFLIGVDGCPHHHRHANELQRISEVNHHVRLSMRRAIRPSDSSRTSCSSGILGTTLRWRSSRSWSSRRHMLSDTNVVSQLADRLKTRINRITSELTPSALAPPPLNTISTTAYSTRDPTQSHRLQTAYSTVTPRQSSIGQISTCALNRGPPLSLAISAVATASSPPADTPKMASIPRSICSSVACAVVHTSPA